MISAPLEFADEGLEGDESLALVELAKRDSLETIVADHAAPERVVEVEDHAFREQPRRGEDRVEQRLREQRKVFEPAGGFRHVPHARVEPLRAPHRGCEKIDVAQKHGLGLARAHGEAVVDLGENRADRVGDLQFVVAEGALARQHEGALNDRRLAVRPERAPQVFQPADRLVGEGAPVARGVQARLELLTGEQDDGILRLKRVERRVAVEDLEVDAVVVPLVHLRLHVVARGDGADDVGQMLGGAVSQERDADDLGGARDVEGFRFLGESEIIQRKHCVFHGVMPTVPIEKIRCSCCDGTIPFSRRLWDGAAQGSARASCSCGGRAGTLSQHYPYSAGKPIPWTR